MRRVILAIVSTATGLVLLLSFKTHSQSTVLGSASAAALGTPAAGGTSSAGGTSGASKSATPAASPATGKASATGTAKTVTGEAVDTIYGPVQVQVTVRNGKVTAVNAVEYPTGTPRDYQINSYAIPQLNSEALAASNANIDSVSGATYTSQGYIGSLQSALDKAGATASR